MGTLDIMRSKSRAENSKEPWGPRQLLGITGSIEGDKILATELRKLHEDAWEGVNTTDPLAPEYQEIYTGDWNPDSRDSWMSRCGYNIAQVCVDSLVSNEMDNDLIPQIDPTKAQSWAGAKIGEALVLSKFRQLDFMEMRSKSTKERIIAGTVILWARWNPTLKDVEVILLDPMSVCATNGARLKSQITEYHYQHPFTPEEIQAQWNGAPYFDPEDEKNDEFTEKVARPFRSPVREYRDCMVVTHEWRGNQRLIDRIVEAGGTKVKDWKPTSWRRTVTVQGVPIENIELETKLPGIIIVPNYEIPDRVFGMGDMKNIRGMVRELSRIIDTIIDNATLTGNPILMVLAMANINLNRLINQPGLTVPVGGRIVRAQDAMAYLVPPSIPVYVPELIPFLVGAIEKATGSVEAVQGQRMKGVTSGRAIQALQQAAGMRPQQKMQNAANGWAQLAKKMLELYAMYAPDELYLRVMGPKGEELARLMKQEQKNSGGWVKEVDGTRNERTGDSMTMVRFSPREAFRDFAENLDWNVTIKMGRPLIGNRQEDLTMAMTAAKMGVMAPEIALEKMGFDDITIEKNTKALAAKAKMEAEAAAMAKGPQGPGGNGNGGMARMDPKMAMEQAFQAARGGAAISQ